MKRVKKVEILKDSENMLYVALKRFKYHIKVPTFKKVYSKL